MLVDTPIGQVHGAPKSTQRPQGFICDSNICVAMTQEKKVPQLFGTNGVRGIVNSDEMDPMFAMKLGMAMGTFMKGKVMIGTDARTSNEMLKSACVSGLMAVGCDVSDFFFFFFFCLLLAVLVCA